MNRRTGHRFARFENQGLFATSATWFDLLEEVVTLVVNKNECREVFYADFPYGFHSELWEFNTFNALDVVLCQDSGRTTDRALVETAILLAGICHLLAAVTFGKHNHAAAVALE